MANLFDSPTLLCLIEDCYCLHLKRSAKGKRGGVKAAFFYRELNVEYLLESGLTTFKIDKYEKMEQLHWKNHIGNWCQFRNRAGSG